MCHVSHIIHFKWFLCCSVLPASMGHVSWSKHGSSAHGVCCLGVSHLLGGGGTVGGNWTGLKTEIGAPPLEGKATLGPVWEKVPKRRSYRRSMGVSYGLAGHPWVGGCS